MEYQFATIEYNQSYQKKYIDIKEFMELIFVMNRDNQLSLTPF